MRKPVKIQFSIAGAIMLLAAGSVLPPTALAQSQSNAQVGDTQNLPPGLDQRFLDTSADPCVDFFQYACANWIKANPIPAEIAERLYMYWQPYHDKLAELTRELAERRGRCILWLLRLPDNSPVGPLWPHDHG